MMMKLNRLAMVLLGLLMIVLDKTHGFMVGSQNTRPRALVSRKGPSSLSSSSRRLSMSSSAAERKRRNTMLGRSGPYFQLDRFGGKVVFGATANLVTQLDRSADGADTIREWLRDSDSIAKSIWDENLLRAKGNQIYQLKLMKLQFVTITLQPSVDVRMWTETSSSSQQQQGTTTTTPVFALQSVGFEPNLQVLPGVGMDANAFGILIEVAGELRPTKDGKGVTGKIAFQTSGSLPPPMRILPEAVLKAASDTINQTITQFAIQSFQRGATAKYKQFKLQQQQRQRQQQQQQRQQQQQQQQQKQQQKQKQEELKEQPKQ